MSICACGSRDLLWNSIAWTIHIILKAGGLSSGSSKDVRFRLSFDLLGLQYDYVTGYSSSSTARLAVQRNEVQYHDETLPGYRTQWSLRW